MRLAFSIALRFLKSGKGQTILILLGIGIGVSVQIFIGSLITGLQKSLIDKTVGGSSQITITTVNDGEFFDDSAEKITLIKGAKPTEIKEVVSVIQSPGILSWDDNDKNVLLRGFDWNEAQGIYKIKDKIIKGELGTGNDHVVIGKDLSEKTDLTLGDSVELLTSQGLKRTFEITGIFDLGIKSINETWVLSDLKNYQNFLEKENQVSAIEIQVNDVFEADRIGSNINEVLADPELVVSDWKSENTQLLSGLAGQTASSLMIQIFVLVSVVLGIASILAISVVQKSKQMGILKAMGLHNSTASQVFLFQGLLLGFFGGILGVFLGLGLTWSFGNFVLNPDGTPVVPFFIDWNFIFISVVIAILASTLAAFVPAIRVSKLDPMEVIKNG